MRALFKKKRIPLIIWIALAAIGITIVIVNTSVSVGPKAYIVQGGGIPLDKRPTQEEMDSHRNETTVIDGVKYIYIDLPEGWQEKAAAEARELAETIEGNIVAEIDSQTQPNKISPETTLNIDRGGYDIIIKGAFIHGITGLTIYNKYGIVFAKTDPFMLDSAFKVVNVPEGKYRIVVDRLSAEGVIVDCLIKILLELTIPELELPGLTAETRTEVTNPYSADLVFENNGIEMTISPKESVMVNLAEGKNEIVYYLKDGDNVSPEKTYNIFSDTTPPVITLQSTMEKYQGSEGRVVFNMRVNEYPSYIKINGKDYEMGYCAPSDSNHDGSYTFAHIADISVRSIVVEAADRVGNVTITTLMR